MRAKVLRALVFTAFSLAVALNQAANAQDGARKLTIAVGLEPANLDPCNSTDSVSGPVLGQNVIETLTVLDPQTSQPSPRLATEWKQTEGNTWRFTLRQGVTFHDGTPFDAAAAAKSIERRLKAYDNATFVCKDGITTLPRTPLTVAVVDDHTIDVSGTPAVPVPMYLAFFGISAPSTDETKMIDNPIGTGPYKLDSWTKGSQIVLTAYDKYWGDKPQATQATFVFRGEAALRASMVAVGEADIGFDIAPQDATDPTMDQAYLTGETTRIRIVNKPPLDDIRVRKALNLATDRNALIGTIMSPKVIASTQMILPRIVGYNPDLKVWPYDPEQAKQLIDAARKDGVNLDQPIRFVARIGHFANVEELVQTLAQMWEAVGIHTKIEMMERGQFIKLANRPYDPDRPAALMTDSHNNYSGDAAFSMFYRYHSKGAQSEFTTPELDKMIDDANSGTIDMETRTKLFQDANRIIAQDIVPDVSLFHMVGYIRVNPRVKYVREGFYDASLFDLHRVTFAQ
jgi:peptide/nickel transport system substrate-binding protein